MVESKKSTITTAKRPAAKTSIAAPKVTPKIVPTSSGARANAAAAAGQGVAASGRGAAVAGRGAAVAGRTPGARAAATTGGPKVMGA